jgi:hypothetical protein
MKKIFTSENLVHCDLVRSTLALSNISALIKNEHSAHSAGAGMGFGLIFAWPEVWVFHDEDLPKAVECLQQSDLSFLPGREAKEEEPEADWVCPGCQEEVPGNFERCWNCGGAQPGE